MTAKSKKVKRSNSPSKVLILLTIVGLMIAAAIAYWLWPASKNASQPVSQPAQGATSKITPHQSAPVNSTNRQGGVVDQKGQTSGSIPPSSQWTSSPSGNITLQQPVAGEIVHSGDTISGIAKVGTVQFILKDNSVGVISQGTLSVVNGKFSGTLQFTPHSSNGELEVFYPNPTTGAEQDIININVNYSI